ncbi:MAG TPA: hypothetical protein VMB47_02495 [Candidatus Aquilonibacter sp.]|nr:hypothetical protein [Candidatus Aquilonibacter sp.]
MNEILPKAVPMTAALFWLLAWSPALAQQSTQMVPPPFPPGNGIVTCVALEVHPNAQPGTTVVLFHQQNRNDQSRFASLLSRADGSYVQIQTRQGRWITASVVRLRNCFGRGLLLLPSSAVRLRDSDVFDVRFSGPGLHN